MIVVGWVGLAAEGEMAERERGLAWGVVPVASCGLRLACPPLPSGASPSSLTAYALSEHFLLAFSGRQVKAWPNFPIFRRGKTKPSKLSDIHTEEGQEVGWKPRTLTPRGSQPTQGEVLPCPTHPQARWTRHLQNQPGMENLYFLCWKGRLKQGPSRRERRTRGQRGAVREVAETRGKGLSPGHSLSSRKKSL